jgi:hypothetical protein
MVLGILSIAMVLGILSIAMVLGILSGGVGHILSLFTDFI